MKPLLVALSNRTSQRLARFAALSIYRKRKSKMQFKVKETTLAELAAKGCLFKDGLWTRVKDQKASGEVRLIYLADIGELTFRDRSQRFITLGKAKALKGTLVKPGDILIARLPAPIGRACLFPARSGKFITINDVVVFRNALKNLDPRYLCYCLNSPLVRARMAALHSGSTRDRISKKKLGEVKIPIVPISMQRKIALNLESLFLKIDEAKEQLKSINKTIALYPETVLQVKPICDDLIQALKKLILFKTSLLKHIFERMI
jgi:type I restriction enzyme S subunit